MWPDGFDPSPPGADGHPTIVEGLRRSTTGAHVVYHDLTLELATVGEVAARHGGAVEVHQANLPVVHASGRRRTLVATPAAVLAAIADNDAWITLFGVNDDEVVRPVVAALSQQLLAVGRTEVTMTVSLICSSAFGVTPAHMDPQDVLLLQLLGTKAFTTGSFNGRTEQEAELRRRFSPARENLRRLPGTHDDWALAPGRGVFIPAYTPHWARVGDEVSVALSVGFSTPELRRREAIHRADAALFRRGIRLPAPGRSAALDEARLRAIRAAKRLAGSAATSRNR